MKKNSMLMFLLSPLTLILISISVLSGEVDCVDSNGKPIKSKTKKYLFNEKAEDIFKR